MNFDLTRTSDHTVVTTQRVKVFLLILHDFSVHAKSQTTDDCGRTRLTLKNFQFYLRFKMTTQNHSVQSQCTLENQYRVEQDYEAIKIKRTASWQ